MNPGMCIFALMPAKTHKSTTDAAVSNITITMTHLRISVISVTFSNDIFFTSCVLPQGDSKCLHTFLIRNPSVTVIRSTDTIKSQLNRRSLHSPELQICLPA